MPTATAIGSETTATSRRCQWVAMPASANADPISAPAIDPMLQNPWHVLMIGRLSVSCTRAASTFIATSTSGEKMPRRKSAANSDARSHAHAGEWQKRQIDQKPEEHRPPRGDLLDQLPGGEQREEAADRHSEECDRKLTRRQPELSCTSGMRGTQFASVIACRKKTAMTSRAGVKNAGKHGGRGTGGARTCARPSVSLGSIASGGVSCPRTVTIRPIFG